VADVYATHPIRKPYAITGGTQDPGRRGIRPEVVIPANPTDNCQYGNPQAWPDSRPEGKKIQKL